MSSRLGLSIDARAAFEATRASLLELLGELDTWEWSASTAAPGWAVRDIVAHLLGDDVSRLSRSRDGHSPPTETDLPRSLHRTNEQWVTALSAASPAVLIDLLRTSSAALRDFWRSVDLNAVGEPVSWISGKPAPVWLDCARDFSEDWIHQAQIREAIGRAPFARTDVRVLLIDTLLRAIPFTLDKYAASGDVLRIEVLDLRQTWTWHCPTDGWRAGGGESSPDAVIAIDSEHLWRLAVRMIEPAEAARHAFISGDTSLAKAALQLVSIIR